jgi:hypothetical protein
MIVRKDGLTIWLPDEVPPEENFFGIDRSIPSNLGIPPDWGKERGWAHYGPLGRLFWSAWDRVRDFVESRRWR